MTIKIDKILEIIFKILTIYFFINVLITALLLIGKFILKSNVSTGYATSYLIVYSILTILSIKLTTLFNNKKQNSIKNTITEIKSFFNKTFSFIFGFLLIKQFTDIYIINKYEYMFTYEWTEHTMLTTPNPYLFFLKTNMPTIILIFYGITFLLFFKSLFTKEQIENFFKDQNKEEKK